MAEGVIMTRFAWLRIGVMALAAPDICGPMIPITVLSEANFRALVAACTGSYWPAVAVPSSSESTSKRTPLTRCFALASATAFIAPYCCRIAPSASPPVSEPSQPILMTLSAARAPCNPEAMVRAEAATAASNARRRAGMLNSQQCWTQLTRI